MIALVEQSHARSNEHLPHDRQDGLLRQLGMTAKVRITAEAGNGGLGLVELTLASHCRTMRAHWHGQTTEIIYVLDGALAFTVGETSFTGIRGRVVTVPPQTVHHLWNPTASSATVLLIYTPSGLESYWAELAALCTPAPTKTEQWIALAAQYDQFLPPVLA